MGQSRGLFVDFTCDISRYEHPRVGDDGDGDGGGDDACDDDACDDVICSKYEIVESSSLIHII